MRVLNNSPVHISYIYVCEKCIIMTVVRPTTPNTARNYFAVTNGFRLNWPPSWYNATPLLFAVRALCKVIIIVPVLNGNVYLSVLTAPMITCDFLLLLFINFFFSLSRISPFTNYYLLFYFVTRHHIDNGRIIKTTKHKTI
jgi:hypothetical protein